jgi:hypothetical protein
VLLESLVLQDRRVCREVLVLQEQQDHRGHLGLQVLREKLVLQGSKDHLGLQESQGL